ncbi:hypothetical protein GPJ56_000699 [Histomonas meleagridis]|uniref:uncharacterized protein n=1 Tax=Histomonas meleagridis TaxID=135588 RepID=UPI00355A1C14|nr:hypothetical protein GPJ56_000699 [Histomonas meleagridis]KAH0804542.1 hypothetical protein GO595_003372 [Histomonas meleagridis]
MFPRNYAANVPAAGIKTHGGDGVASCMRYDEKYQGPERQKLFRSHHLGEPGERIHTPGIMPTTFPDNVAFGIHSGAKNGSTYECVHEVPSNCSKVYQEFLDKQEEQYQRAKCPLGHGPKPISKIPDDLKKRGFGVSTRFGEKAGTVIQDSKTDIPNDKTLGVGYQTRRNYQWGKINPVTHTFGVTGPQRNVDHLTEIMNYDNSPRIVPLAVDRAQNNAIQPDFDPGNPYTNMKEYKMNSTRYRTRRDPCELPPAGISTVSSEFTVGDTLAGMGAMDSFGENYDTKVRDYNPADHITHGVSTKPNPFPNPLSGNGRYENLGLTNEDFMKLRDKAHVVPVMVAALGLRTDEANEIFDNVANQLGRKLISVLEFHEAYRKMN